MFDCRHSAVPLGQFHCVFLQQCEDKQVSVCLHILDECDDAVGVNGFQRVEQGTVSATSWAR